jgi:hypothetical protein
MYEPDFSNDGDMLIGKASRFTQDFKIIPHEMMVRGIFHSESYRSVVYAGRHESIQEIIDTCVHETIHGVVQESIDDLEENELKIDIEQEHNAIRYMMWADEFLV